MRSKRRLRPRATVAASVALVAIAAAVALLRTHGSEPPVKTIRTSRGDVTVTLRETGTIIPRETIAIKSKVSGRLASLLVAPGDIAAPGATLAVIEPDSGESLALVQKRLDWRRAKIDFDQKKRDYDRASQLNRQGLAPASDFEHARNEMDQARSSLDLALYGLNLLEDEFHQPRTRGDQPSAERAADTKTSFRVVSPARGTVLAVDHRVGELVPSGTTGFNSDSTTILELADVSDLVVKCQVSEIDVPHLKPGMKASLELSSGPGKKFSGEIRTVGLTAAASTEKDKPISYDVTLLPDRAPEGLRIGMSCNVDFTLETRRNVIRIPVLAYMEKDGKTFVSVARKRKMIDREVVLGLKSDQYAEVVSGLHEGDLLAARYPLPAAAETP